MSHYRIPELLRFFPTNFCKVKGIKKIFALSDFWARKPHQYAKDLMGSSFEYCFCCFAPPYSNPDHFFTFFNDQIRKEIKFIGYPRCVDANCFKDYGLLKTHDVITTGAMWHFYPLRTHMHNYLNYHSKELGIKYCNYPHCGVNFSHGDFVREKYAKAINQSKILVSCGGRYHVAFNKIFEAMGCKTAYVGERPWGADELHLKDGYNYIEVTSHNFIEKIKYYLNNPDDLKTVIDNASNTFEKYYHIDARANDFVKLLKLI